MTQRTNIPLEAVLGGPETMYPEYRQVIRANYTPPPPAPPGGRGAGAAAPAPARRGAPPPSVGRGAPPPK